MKILKKMVCGIRLFNREIGGVVRRGTGAKDVGLEKLVNKGLKSQKALSQGSTGEW